MLRWISLLIAASLYVHHAKGCVPGSTQGDSCASFGDLLYTTFHALGAGSKAGIHASTFYLDVEQAEIACKRRGMQLTEVTSLPMFNSIISSLEGINPYDTQTYLIGGRYHNGRFVFENGHQLPSNLPWHQGEPSRTQGNHNEDCLALERRNGNFRLNDVRCWDMNSRYLCAGSPMT